MKNNVTLTLGVCIVTSDEIESCQQFVDAVQTDFDVQPGDIDMLFLDLPDTAPVLVHETVPIVASSAMSNIRTDGICAFTWADTDPDYKSRVMFMGYSSYMLDLLPKDFVESHVSKGMSADDLKWLKEWDKSTEIKITRAPKHGQMVIDDSMDADHPVYVPDKNFVGKDSVEVLVSAKDLEGRPISKKLVYFINVLPQKEMDKVVSRHKAMVKKYCGTSKPDWRISGSASPDGGSEAAAIDLAALQGNAIYSALLTDASQTLTGFANLSGSAVAETSGEALSATITLDDNAAGYGWYLDPTPDANEEYLATSNPNEWIAKAGTEATGKMDLLSVLLHEYGHVLGIEHSADPHDYMATTLAPGVRRLPSADELALMAKLAGEARAGEVSGVRDVLISPFPSHIR